jgi:hypothetical protein
MSRVKYLYMIVVKQVVMCRLRGFVKISIPIILSSVGTIYMVADGFNRRYKVRKNTTSSVGTAHK